MARGHIFSVDIDNADSWTVDRFCVVLYYMFPFQYAWATDLNDIRWSTSSGTRFSRDRPNVENSEREYGVFLQNSSNTPSMLIARMSIRSGRNWPANIGNWAGAKDDTGQVRDEDTWLSYPALDTGRKLVFTAVDPLNQARVPTCSIRIVLAEL